MNRKPFKSPSRSISPSGQTDRHQKFQPKSAGIQKKNIKKSNQDVQVFTSLPPKIDGEIKCTLRLQIAKLTITKANDKDSGRNFVVRCLWWGEKSSGAIFKPNSDTGSTQTVAKYMIRCGPKQFKAYLNDMKSLDFDLVDETSMEVVARAHLFEIGQLAPNCPIKGNFPMFNAQKSRVAEISVSISIEEFKQDIKVITPTPASQANINEFNVKFQEFEKKHQDMVSVSHKSPVKTAIINNLIEKGLRLKSEMSKSASNLNTLTDSLSNSLSFVAEKNGGSNPDMSRLSDPLYDPSMLSALIYDPDLKLSNSRNKLDETFDDPELRELLAPSNLYTKYDQDEPVKLLKDNDSRLHTRPFTPWSDDDSDFKDTQTLNRNRVSFEIQSSDGEMSSSGLYSNYLDVLSSQRISLLNLVQIAKLRLNKLTFFTLHNIGSIIDRLQLKSSLTTSTNSRSRPPVAVRKPDMSSLFFVEYQFPVVAPNQKGNQQLMMATQSMRVNAKRVKTIDVTGSNNSINRNSEEDCVSFEHEADYSVLFNSSTLEAWWNSAIVFKIYFRTGTECNQPCLIGLARLSLKNVLKSKNFKLIKKLAVLDQIVDAKSGVAKRVGTLHVSLELTSDIKEFNTDLIKLKNNEPRKKLSSLSVKSANNSQTDLKPKTSLSSQSTSALPNRPTNSPSKFIYEQRQEDSSGEAFCLPIQMYMSVSEGRNFHLHSTSSTEPTTIYLICRLFWCKEKVKFETVTKQPATFLSTTQFSWTLNLTFSLKPSLIENMRNNFMVIEAWQKRRDGDSLIGTIKLPLNEFYLQLKALSNIKEFLNNSTSMPIIGVDGWLASQDPFSGQKSGEINILLAMGSGDQILNLQKYMFDKARIKFNMIASGSVGNSTTSLTGLNQPHQASDHVQHTFTFVIDNIKVHPIRAGMRNNEIVLDETDYYIRYHFPSGDDNNMLKSYTSSTRLNTSFCNKVEHRLVLEKERPLQHTLFNLLPKVNFELWSKSYIPNLREKLIGVGELSIEKLLTVVENVNPNCNLNNKSFVIPLLQVTENDDNLDQILVSRDKYCGQLFLTIEYRREQAHSDRLTTIIKKPFQQIENESNSVFLNIGILRVNGLRTTIRNIISKNNSSSAAPFFTLENSKLFVKFSLAFLNQSQSFKSTKSISSATSDCSPEFFDYFDIKCPLLSWYNPAIGRSVSLAEQLELGQVIFEIWITFTDPYTQSTSDLLIGNCSLQLEPLLENRIGIRGWFPISSAALSSSQGLQTKFLNEHDIGALELAIRFSKAEEYLRVLEAGQQIGWTKRRTISESSSELFNSHTSRLKPITPDNSPCSTTPDLIERGVKFLIEIQRAAHIPYVYDEKLDQNVPPDVFVTFSSINDDKNSTPIAYKQTSPVWNYEILVELNQDHFLDPNKNFVLKVWHKSTRSQMLGCVSVDLTPMVCGLAQINGWYNINNSAGQTKGQLKICLTPQENLSRFKQAMLDKKMKNQLSNTVSSNRLESYSQCSFASLSTSRSESDHVKSYQIRSSSSSTINTERLASSTSSRDNTLIVAKDTNELKIGLAQKLSELDHLNKMLRQRLETNGKSNKNISNNSPPPVETKQVTESSSQTSIDPVGKVDNDKVDKADVAINTSLKETDLLIQTDEKLNQSAVPDSFWASFEDVENLIEDIDVQNPQLNPVASTEQPQNQSVLNPTLNEDLEIDDDDTDLDQTLNINTSVDIKLNQQQVNNSEIVNEEVSDEQVYNIIDCNEAELEPEEVPLYHNNNISLIVIETNNEANEQDDENVTIVIPEELNKINTEINENNDQDEKQAPETKIVDNEIADKLKSLSMKIPNYFMPKDDLERTMKQLVGADGENQKKENVKSKATILLLQNQKVLKRQDINRINKIFYS